MLNLSQRSKKHFSPLRYPGGKSCLSNFISDIIEENNFSSYTYVEPYAGGAGAALTLLTLEKVERIIINDFDKAIFAFWKSIIENTDRFIKKIETTPITMMEWQKQKKVYNSLPNDYFKLGFSVFYLNRTNRSGIIEGGPIGGRDQSSKWTISARFNKEALIERIKKISLYKKRITVTNEDGLCLINSLRPKKKIFTYLDPPYYVKGSSLYLNHYKHIDHEKLANLLNSNTKMNWILTYDNVHEIRNLYEQRYSHEFTLNYHADKPKKGQELLILSDNIIMPKKYF